MNKTETCFVELSRETRENLVCRLCIHFYKDIDIIKKSEDFRFLETLFEMEEEIFMKSADINTYYEFFNNMYHIPLCFFTNKAELKNEDDSAVSELSQPKTLPCRQNQSTVHPSDVKPLLQKSLDNYDDSITSQYGEILDYDLKSPTQDDVKPLKNHTTNLNLIIESLSTQQLKKGPAALQHVFEALIIHLKDQPEAKLFLKPIETIKLKSIPKYLKSVTKKIDFTTMDKKLEKAEYASMWSLIADVKGMTDSVCRFFRKNTKIYNNAQKVSYCDQLIHLFTNQLIIIYLF